MQMHNYIYGHVLLNEISVKDTIHNITLDP
jgi:hypothetical protein